jgi:L-lactate dehydrogenase
MVPVWSSAAAGGLPLEKFPGWSSAQAEALFTRTKKSGAEVIGLKGGAGFAVGLSIREVVHSIALDSRRILPVSALVNGEYGMSDVCISVPTVVGRKGVHAQLEIELWPKEISALQHSAQVLRETIDQVLKNDSKPANVGGGSAPLSVSPSKSGQGSTDKSPTAKRTVRVTMGAGGSGNLTGAGSRVTISGLGQGNGRGGR